MTCHPQSLVAQGQHATTGGGKLGASYGPVTILCALVDLQLKQSVVTKRHGMLYTTYEL